MSNSLILRRRLALTLVLSAAVGLLSACDTPTAPTRGAVSGPARVAPTPTFAPTPIPTPSPSPSPEPALIQFFGAVTDEDGMPLIGAFVEADYLDGKGHGDWRLVKTIDGGRYSMHVPARPNSQVFGVPNTLAVVYSGFSGYDSNVQIVGGNATENTVDFRLRRLRRIDAGASITIAIEHDSSLCADLDVNFNFKARCENVYISAATTGTLTIETRSVSPGGVVPLVQTADPWSAAPGILSLPVKAGQVYSIRLEIPIDAAPQEYLVLTSIQSNIR